MMAAIAPAPAGTASCMASPRKRTSLMASSSLSAEEATSALYSPSEWPAALAGSGSFVVSFNAASAAMLVARIAGWVLRVSVSSASGPSKQIALMLSPSARSARSNTSREEENAIARSFPIPTNCDPCPGKHQATRMSHPYQCAAPGDACTKRAHEHGMPRPDDAAPHRLVEGDGDRCARSISIALDV